MSTPNTQRVQGVQVKGEQLNVAVCTRNLLVWRTHSTPPQNGVAHGPGHTGVVGPVLPCVELNEQADSFTVAR